MPETMETAQRLSNDLLTLRDSTCPSDIGYTLTLAAGFIVGLASRCEAAEAQDDAPADGTEWSCVQGADTASTALLAEIAKADVWDEAEGGKNSNGGISRDFQEFREEQAQDWIMRARAIRDAPAEGMATAGAEERWINDTENACPACGGSGHKGDTRGEDVPAREWIARAIASVCPVKEPMSLHYQMADRALAALGSEWKSIHAEPPAPGSVFVAISSDASGADYYLRDEAGNYWTAEGHETSIYGIGLDGSIWTQAPNFEDFRPWASKPKDRP